jgi:hypothetical protein
VAVSTAVCAEFTGEIVAVKLTVVDPAATVKEAGTEIAGLLLATLKLKPPLGAAVFSVTVQPSLPAPVIELIVQVRPLNTGTSALPWPIVEAFNCKTNVSPTPFALALSATASVELTDETVAVKPAEVDPAATVTVAGKTTAALLLAKLTTKPPLGAAALNVTVHPSFPSPVIDPRAQLRPFKAGSTALP